jgi:flagellar hook-associated protein 2
VGTFGSVAGLSDALTGSITIQVGSGIAQTIDVPPVSGSSPTNDLSGLADAINAVGIGVTALVVTDSTTGVSSLQLTSGTVGSAGALRVTSKVQDTTSLTNTTLNYTNASDINSLTSLGISVNNDGTLSFDATSLDSVLNTDYSSVAGFFQSATSWGQSFSAMLTNAGTSSSTGILSLGLTSNSNIEATLNADISKEELLISAEQSSLTTELNTANQIMQQLPSMLDQVNELYSAITGYNQQTNG